MNGKKVSDFTGEPPEGGSVFGFAFYSGKSNTEPTTFILKSIEVHEVAPNSHREGSAAALVERDRERRRRKTD